MNSKFRPLVVGVGGTIRPGSSSEMALRFALTHVQQLGAQVELFCGETINLPMFTPAAGPRADKAKSLIAALRRANGVILASPGYHGSVSGLIKNALDYTEDMREDQYPYLEGRAVGIIACASGWQATGTTLSSLRSIVHALRGWPTPLAVAINSASTPFKEDGMPSSTSVAEQLSVLASHVVEFAHMRAFRALAVPATTMDIAT
jgi:FMN reductase